MQCPRCAFDNRAAVKFCENCGSPLALICPQCNAPLSSGAKFCGACGTPTPALPRFAGEGERFAGEGERFGGEGERLAALQQSAPAALQEKIRAGSAQVEGERKPVTILFTDIVGSTSLAEKLDPEEWKEIVNGAHQRISDAVYRYEGTIAQLLGDGVLAFFGAPITHEDDPVRAVRAALDIQSAINKYADELRGYADNFQLRVGIHTGLVVVGAVGSDMHVEYLAIGDAVNLAARLQSAAQPSKVLISEATAKLVRAAMELKELGEISVKGKSEPVRVFEVAEAKAAPESGRGIEGLSSPLVGRERELMLLNQCLDVLRDGRGQIVAIIGEAGIGKSRLVEEARNWRLEVGSWKLEKGTQPPTSNLQPPTSNFHWLEGRALSYGQTLSFWTITQLLKADLGLSDADPEPKIRVTLRRRVNALFGERAAQVLPYLAHLLGIKLEGELAEQIRVLDGETLKRQTLVSLADYFARIAHECPTVLVFEDAHWADPSTLDALEALLPLTDRVPLMLVILMRLEREHGAWRVKVQAETEFAHRYTEIALAPLSPAESEQLVDSLLEIAELPDGIRRLMLERSEGNPFYLEEVIRSLIEQGAIVHEGNTWRAQSLISNLQIPETLQGVLLARIDRLEEDVRRTLQLASVIGKSFLYRLLEAIAEAEQQLDGHLSQLQRADLVREKTRRPELEYIFKHSLTQEAAYNSLLIERRREFHRRVASALEELFADRKEEFYGLLAHHFDAAGEREKAVEYLLQAGDKTRLEDAHEEALRHYRRAIELLAELGDDERAARTWLKLGLVYSINFDFDAAHQANEKAFALQQQARSAPSLALRAPASGHPNIVRFLLPYQTLVVDPAQIAFYPPGWFASHIFSGLAEIDLELNVVPHVAKSWQVLDDGTRYVFRLRDDVRWTDGTPITAADFEWAWKRNLLPATQSPTAFLLDDIVGARDFREGRLANPDNVGIHALDPWTLEVRLTTPIAYFPYVFTQPITYPLPRALIERYGDEWIKTQPLISNGAFRWISVSPTENVLERNPDFFGECPGNVDRVEIVALPDHLERWRAFREGQADASLVRHSDLPPDLVSRSAKRYGLNCIHLILEPTRPPLDDIRVRRALMYALERGRIAAEMGSTSARGGLVPPGMPGHSPDLALEYDPVAARRLLAQAGYLEGKTLRLVLRYLPHLPYAEIVRQWRETLGVQVECVAGNLLSQDESAPTILLNGWVADYPDPHNFLRDAIFRFAAGWLDPTLKELIEDAARVRNRAQRMAMYREADRRLCVEEAFIFPLTYGEQTTVWITQPWIKHFPISALGALSSKYITVEPHEA